MYDHVLMKMKINAKITKKMSESVSNLTLSFV